MSADYKAYMQSAIHTQFFVGTKIKIIWLAVTFNKTLPNGKRDTFLA